MDIKSSLTKKHNKYGSYEEIWEMLILVALYIYDYEFRQERLSLATHTNAPSRKFTCCLNLFEMLAEDEMFKGNIQNLKFYYANAKVKYSFIYTQVKIEAEFDFRSNMASISLELLTDTENDRKTFESIRKQLEPAFMS